MVPTIFSSVLYKTYAKISPFSHPSANQTVFCVRLQLLHIVNPEEKLAQSVARYVNGVEKPVSHCGCRRACRQSRRFDFRNDFKRFIHIFSLLCSCRFNRFQTEFVGNDQTFVGTHFGQIKTTRGFSGTCPVSAMTFRSLI